jgi:excisionase family DNA binding protein
VRILTCKEVAQLLNIKVHTIYAWAEQGLIPCLKLNGALRFDESEVISWIQECKRPGRCYNSTIQVRGPKGGKG